MASDLDAQGAGTAPTDSAPPMGPGEPPPDDLARELFHLNRRHSYDLAVPIRSHRRLVGRLVVALKRQMRPWLYGTLEPAFEGQQEFNRTAVRFLNAAKERLDRIEQAVRETERGRADILRRIEDLDVKLESYMSVLSRRIAHLESDAGPGVGKPSPPDQ